MIINYKLLKIILNREFFFTVAEIVSDVLKMSVSVNHVPCELPVNNIFFMTLDISFSHIND